MPLESRFRRYFQLVSHYHRSPPERRGTLINGLFKIESMPDHPNPEPCKRYLRRFIDHQKEKAATG